MAAEGFYPSNAVTNRTNATPQSDSVVYDADSILMERDILKAVDQSWDDQDFMTSLEANARLVKASKFYNYEQGSLFRDSRVATASAGQSASTITLDASAYSAITELGGTIDRAPLIVGDIIPLIGDLYAQVTSASGAGTATQYVLTRIGTTGDIGAALALHVAGGATTPIVAQGNAFGEGTDMPTVGLDTPFTRFQGQFQIMKTLAPNVTGDLASHDMAVTVGGTSHVVNKLKMETLKRHRIKQNLQLMLGPGGSVNGVTLTNSLRSNLKANGNQLYYNAGTGFSLANLDTLTTKIKRLLGVTEVHWYIGDELRNAIEDLIRPFTENGGIQYNSFGMGNGKNRAVDLGFSSFTYHGVTFHLQEFRIHPILMGQSYMSYAKEGYIVPGNKMSVTKVDDENGLKTVSMPSLTICYKSQSNGQSRRFKEVYRDIDITFKDKLEMGIQSQEGLQQVAISRSFFIAPAS
ncbi:hypothetical protein [Hymenobacter koreensis]|uniref:Phage major capsid protein n=1 Tax=Hymenobacter koreensis TaxID=1084523 RepID=A0ABP8JK43_9BACT